MSINQITPIYMAKPVIGEEEITEVESVLKSGQISEGEVVRQFEKEFAAFIGTEHAIAVNSGTAAIYIALLAYGIGPGDEVITTPFSFIATANAILLTGARPVFADILPDTFNIDPVDVRNKVTPNTKAVLPVHLYGLACDIAAISRVAVEFGLVLIEDACQAHGAEYNRQKVGSFGTGCFSFYPTKNMTTGEGGMITTDNAEVAGAARLIANHGQAKRYYHETLGYNYRMTNIAGALGCCQLKKLPGFNKARIDHANFLSRELDDIQGLKVPVITDPDIKHVYHQYTLRLTSDFPVSRDDFRQFLKEKGIVTEVYYPIPIHQQPLYRRFGYKDKLPVTEKAAAEVVSIPVHPSLNDNDLQYIIDCIKGSIS